MKNNNFKSGYSDVNGLKMYYEIYGEGKPLVMIHGGGSNIQISFGRIIPLLAKHRQIIAMDLQAHGRTNDRETYSTFQQDADDVAQLLKNIGITKADFLGFSNGGHTLIEIALRHPGILNKIIICSSFYKRSGTYSKLWAGFNNATIDRIPQHLKDEFLKVNNNPDAFLNMFEKDVHRMKFFKDWTDGQIKSIQAPAFIMNGTYDVSNPEHAVEMYRLIPNCELTILPSGHGEYIGEKDPEMKHSILPDITVALIEKFLNK
jgi:pimeloyl-ACP methyl ester carboxylesterase